MLSTRRSRKSILRYLTPESTLITPNMTSNNSNGYIASGGSATIWSQPFGAFDGIKTSPLLSTGVNEYSGLGFGYLRLQLPQVKTVTSYKIYAGYNMAGKERSPRDFTFQGSNEGINWTVLDTQTGQVWATGGEERAFNILVPNKYLYYQLVPTLANGSIQDIVIGELSLYAY